MHLWHFYSSWLLIKCKLYSFYSLSLCYNNYFAYGIIIPILLPQRVQAMLKNKDGHSTLEFYNLCSHILYFHLFFQMFQYIVASICHFSAKCKEITDGLRPRTLLYDSRLYFFVFFKKNWLL